MDAGVRHDAAMALNDPPLEARRVVDALKGVRKTPYLSECLKLLASGLTWPEIAGRTGRSPEDVERIFFPICQLANINGGYSNEEKEHIIRSGYSLWTELTRSTTPLPAPTPKPSAQKEESRLSGRGKEVERVMDALKKLSPMNLQLIAAFSRGSSVDELSMSRRLPRQDIQAALNTIYERVGFSRKPTPHQTKLVRDALAIMPPALLRPQSAQEDAPSAKAQETTSPEPAAVEDPDEASATPDADPEPERSPDAPEPGAHASDVASSEPEPVVQTVSPYRFSLSPERTDEAVQMVVERIPNLTATQTKILRALLRGYRREKLAEAIEYGSAGSAEAAASWIRNRLGLTRLQLATDDTVIIMRKAWKILHPEADESVFEPEPEPEADAEPEPDTAADPEPVQVTEEPPPELEESHPEPEAEEEPPEPQDVTVQPTASQEVQSVPDPDSAQSVMSLASDSEDYEERGARLVAKGYRPEIVQTNLNLRSGKTSSYVIFVKRASP